MIRRRFTVLLLALLLTAFPPLSALADGLDDILEKGTIRVGVSFFMPWTMKDTEGVLHGFEVDVANKLASDMGIRPEFHVYAWEDLVAALEKREIDVILAGLAITPERALKVNFTRPYADSGISMATNTAMTRDIADLREVNAPDVKIAVVSKTISADLARKMFDKATITEFVSSDEARRAVVEGRTHAYVATTPQPRFLALEHPDKVDVPLARPLLVYKAGMAIHKGEQELLNFLNAWITAREAGGWLSARHNFWFRSLQWQGGIDQ